MSAILFPVKTAAKRACFKPSSLAQRESGFIQGVILFGIALLAVVIAAFSMSNKSTTNSTDAEEAKTLASAIITQGGSIKSAVDRFRIDRGDLSTMNFSATSPDGLFNPTDLFIRTLTVQPRAFNNGEAPIMTTVSNTQNGAYFLRRRTGSETITIGGIGVSLLTSTTGLTDRACSRINVTLHGPTYANRVITLTTGNVAAFQGGTGNIDITNTATSLHFPGIANLEEGCVKTSDGGNAARNVYFKVLAVN